MKVLTILISLIAIDVFSQTYDTDVADIFAGENQEILI